MATGKQLAFMCGEISPTMRFNSREVSYATGLTRLKNGYVRGEGGISNRPGFKLNSKALDGSSYPGFLLPRQEDMQPDITGFDPLKPSITMLSFWDNSSKRWRVVEFCEKIHPDAASLPLYDGGKVLHYRFDTYGVFLPVDPGYIGKPFDDVTGYVQLPVPIAELRLVVVDSYLLFLPYAVWKEWKYELSLQMLDKFCTMNLAYSLERDRFEIFGQDGGANGRPTYDSVNSTFKGAISAPPYFPARYLMTLEDEEGFEYATALTPTAISDITTWNPGGSPGIEMLYSASNVSSTWKSRFTFNDILSGKDATKFIVRLYKTSWASGPYETMNFSLVASGTLSDVGIDTYEVQLQDFGASDPTTKPPVVSYMVNQPLEGTLTALSDQWDILGNATSACFFQQRLHAYVTQVPNFYQEAPIGGGSTRTAVASKPARGKGEYLCSRLNAPRLINQPIAYSRPSDPFIYKVQGMRGENPLFSVAMERPIHFTSRGVYALMGDPAGNIIATSVNPERISDIGCYHSVEPKVIGDSTFFVSQDGKRLHRILWQGSQAGYKVVEISKFSSHLLAEEEVIRIEGTSNHEDVVYVLTQKGRIICVTVNEDSYGWGTIEIEGGHIENICSIKVKPNYELEFDNYEAEKFNDVISAYIVRNGVRTLEFLDDRADYGPTENQVFLDSAVFMGSALTIKGQYHWPVSPPMAGYYRQSWDTDYGVGDILPMLSPCSQSNDMAYMSFFSYFAKPQVGINFGDSSTVDWTPGSSIEIYTKEILVPGGVYLNAGDPIVGIDFNAEEAFRLDVSYEEEYLDSERNIKTMLRTCQVSVDISSMEADTSLTGFAHKYQATITEGLFPEDLRDVYSKAISNKEKSLRYTSWRYAYKTFAAKLYPQVVHPLTTLYYSAPEKFRTPEGITLSAISGTRTLGSPLLPEGYNVRKTLLVKETYADGERVRVDFDEYLTGVWLGFPYEFEMETLPIESSDNRTLFTGKTNVSDVGLGLFNTYGGYIGMPRTSLERMEPMDNLRNTAPYFLAQTPTSYSGYVSYSIPSEWSEGSVTIKHVDPTAITVAAIFPRGESSSRG